MKVIGMRCNKYYGEIHREGVSIVVVHHTKTYEYEVQKNYTDTSIRISTNPGGKENTIMKVVTQI